VKLLLNGTVHENDEGRTLGDLVRALGVRVETVAAEVNGAVVPRAAWATTRLKDGDRIEIVTLTGGG
jgi:sulfur carrier protein